MAEHFVAEPRSAEAAEQAAPETAAPAAAAIPVAAVARPVSGAAISGAAGAVARPAVAAAVVRALPRADERPDDEEHEERDDDPPEHTDVYSAGLRLLRVVVRAARGRGAVLRVQMRAVHVEHRVYAAGDAAVIVSGFELGVDRA